MPAETKIQTQSEVEEKMVDLPDTGSPVDVDIADTKKVVNPDEEDQPNFFTSCFGSSKVEPEP